MKLSAPELKNYIIQEAQKMALAHGWSINEEISNKIAESTISKITNSDFELIDPADYIVQPLTEEVAIDINEPVETITEVKKLNEELKRMKQLVDFRSPLFIKD